MRCETPDRSACQIFELYPGDSRDRYYQRRIISAMSSETEGSAQTLILGPSSDSVHGFTPSTEPVVKKAAPGSPESKEPTIRWNLATVHDFYAVFLEGHAQSGCVLDQEGFLLRSKMTADFRIPIQREPEVDDLDRVPVYDKFIAFHTNLLSSDEEARMVNLLTQTFSSFFDAPLPDGDSGGGLHVSQRRALRPMCADAICNALLYILMYRFNDTTSFLRKHHPNFVSSFVAFVFAHNTKASLDSLKSQLSVCTCDRADSLIDSMHFRAKAECTVPTWDELFEALTTPIFSLLELLVDKLDFSKSDKLVKRKVSKTKPSDMGYMVFIYYIYEEPEVMVGACYNWFKRYYKPSVIWFLRRARRLHKTALKTSISQFPKLPRLAVELIEVLTMDIARTEEMTKFRMYVMQTVCDFASDYPSDLQGPPTATPLATPPISPADADYIFATTYKLLRSVHTPPFSNVPGVQKYYHPSVLFFLVPWCKRLYLSRFLSKYDMETEIQKNALASYDERTIDDEELKTPCATAYYAMLALRRDLKQCLSSSCGKARQPGHPHLLRCTRCQVFSYCSKPCLVAAWSEPGSGHKRLCKSLAILSKLWVGNKDLAETLRKSNEEAWKTPQTEDPTQWYRKCRHVRLKRADEILWRQAKDAGMTLAEMQGIAETFIEHGSIKVLG